MCLCRAPWRRTSLIRFVRGSSLARARTRRRRRNGLVRAGRAGSSAAPHIHTCARSQTQSRPPGPPRPSPSSHLSAPAATPRPSVPRRAVLMNTLDMLSYAGGRGGDVQVRTIHRTTQCTQCIHHRVVGHVRCRSWHQPARQPGDGQARTADSAQRSRQRRRHSARAAPSSAHTRLHRAPFRTTARIVASVSVVRMSAARMSAAHG